MAETPKGPAPTNEAVFENALLEVARAQAKLSKFEATSKLAREAEAKLVQERHGLSMKDFREQRTELTVALNKARKSAGKVAG